MRKLLVAKIKRVSVDFWWKVCFFLSGFLSSSGSTRQFWISRVCCYSESSSVVTLLPTKKSPRHWSFINPSDGESLICFDQRNGMSKLLFDNQEFKRNQGKCIGSRPWSPRQVFIVADDLEPRFEPPLLSRRGSLKKRRVRRLKNGGF